MPPLVHIPFPTHKVVFPKHVQVFVEALHALNGLIHQEGKGESVVVLLSGILIHNSLELCSAPTEHSHNQIIHYPLSYARVGVLAVQSCVVL